MLLRFLIMIAFGLVMYVTYRIVIKWQISRAGQLKDMDPLLAEVNLSIPTVVYFTTPMCVLCRTTQWPAFKRLQTNMNPINIVKVDASKDPDSAQRWGVFNVPTTFVLDQDGNPVKVNNGFVDEHKLLTQLLAAHGRV